MLPGLSADQTDRLTDCKRPSSIIVNKYLNSQFIFDIIIAGTAIAIAIAIAISKWGLLKHHQSFSFHFRPLGTLPLSSPPDTLVSHRTLSHFYFSFVFFSVQSKTSQICCLVSRANGCMYDCVYVCVGVCMCMCAFVWACLRVCLLCNVSTDNKKVAASLQIELRNRQKGTERRAHTLLV